MSYHGYEGIALDLDERDRLVHDLGQNRAMILRNHGLLVGGRTIPEAWSDLYYLERACQAQVAAGDGELVLPPGGGVPNTRRKQFDGEGTLAHCEWAWESALRQIEGGKTDYRS